MLNRGTEIRAQAEEESVPQPPLREPRWATTPKPKPVTKAVPAPAATVQWIQPASSAGANVGVTMQFQAFAPANVGAARVPRAKSEFHWHRVVHLDVALPVIAAVLVLIVLLAWGA
ncbi:MAG: hypothetical protein H0U92_02075 [Actinobacteria bacterium]|nr:hypothetical protein [Actinomycetota bacterium]